MLQTKRQQIVGTVRERERESKSLKKIDFICSAKNVRKNKAEKEIIINRNTKIKGKKAIKKRMEYELKKLVCKIKIASTSFEKHILSFLRACETCRICANRTIAEKDKYA